MCHFFERGRCLKGERCNHAHGSEDMRPAIRRQQALELEARQQAAASTGGVIGDANTTAAATAWGTAPLNMGLAGHSTAATAPLGLRSPLSPLPLAELLGESAANGNSGTPVPPMPMGFDNIGQSPDLFNMWSAWTPQSAFGGPLSLPLPMPPPNPLANANPPGTPLGGYQGVSPLPGSLHVHPATAPPAAFGGGPLGSPLPGTASATGKAEGALSKAPGPDDSIKCDLSDRLASLDLVCNGLAGDVRALTGGSPAGETGAIGVGGPEAQRLVHRI
jgi:hypothetical protein